MQMTEPFLTIIIPVYNLEGLLPRCVKSCLNQTGVSHNEYEIVIVNDGSTDGSLAAARRLAEGNTNVTVLTQGNAGPGAARNAGTKAAKGRYLWFVDADDWIGRDALAFLKGEIAAHSADWLSICSMHTSGGGLRNLLPKTDDPKRIFLGRKWSDMDTAYVWQRKFLQDNDLAFKEKLLFEDSEWMPRTLYLAGSCHVTNKLLYHIYDREGSITRSISLRHGRDRIAVAEHLLRFRDERVPEADCRQTFNQRICVNLNRAFLAMTAFPKDECMAFNRMLAEKPRLPHVFWESSVLRYKAEWLLFGILGRNYVKAFRFLNLFKRLK